MIISASRRTDLPAFYSQWFFQRLQEGYVLVRNPVNPRQVSRVSLAPEVVDGFVFWTKNPGPMLPWLDRPAGLPLLFPGDAYPLWRRDRTESSFQKRGDFARRTAVGPPDWAGTGDLAV